jgi:hypothetical protein
VKEQQISKLRARREKEEEIKSFEYVCMLHRKMLTMICGCQIYIIFISFPSPACIYVIIIHTVGTVSEPSACCDYVIKSKDKCLFHFLFLFWRGRAEAGKKRQHKMSIRRRNNNHNFHLINR